MPKASGGRQSPVFIQEQRQGVHTPCSPKSSILQGFVDSLCVIFKPG